MVDRLHDNFGCRLADNFSAEEQLSNQQHQVCECQVQHRQGHYEGSSVRPYGLMRVEYNHESVDRHEGKHQHQAAAEEGEHLEQLEDDQEDEGAHHALEHVQRVLVG